MSMIFISFERAYAISY